MDLQEADRIISHYQGALNYQLYLTPTNFLSENKKFLFEYERGVVYNPQYRYEQLPNIDDDLLDNVITDLDGNKNGFSVVLKNAALSLSKEIKMYRAIGDDNIFTPSSIEVYHEPQKELCLEAEEYLKKTKSKKEKNDYIPATVLASIIADRLREYGFKWKIELMNNMASRISVEPTQKAVFINRNKFFSKNDIIRLVVHEVDTHVLRAENGIKHGLDVLGNGTADSMMHEEGLALFNEWIKQVQDVEVMKLYAARFLCCCKMELSFFEMFDMLIKMGCSKEQAIYVVSRIKRGLSDTSLAGGFIKDYIYYQGFIDVRNYLSKYPSEYEKLYYGSISIGDIGMLGEIIEKAHAENSITVPLPLEMNG